MKKRQRLMVLLWFWVTILVIDAILFAGDIASASDVFILIIDALCLVVTLYEMGLIGQK